MSLSLPAREDTDMGEATSHASQACTPCRKQKRKCDKILPTCSLCSRMGRLCDYTETQQAPTAEDFMSMQQKILELEQRLNQKDQIPNSSSPPSIQTSPPPSTGPTAPLYQAINTTTPPWMPAQSKFPSALFLDIDCFKWANMHIPKPSVEVPMDVLEILSNSNALHQAVTDYFNTVHIWMPIISKKRMNLGHPLWEGGPDLALLFLAMKLVASQPVNGVPSAENPLYISSKRFLSLLESGGTISILYLQAMVLVAIYEIGHSIYPSAWMTMAACVRYADVLGIPNYQDSCLVLGQCATWTEIEERRRVWWGIFVLDRLVCLGNKRRCLVPEPGPNDILPTDDNAWDNGDVAKALQTTVSVAFSERQGAFARTCQAAILIGRVESHVQETIRRHRTHTPEPFSTDEVNTLIDDLNNFVTIISLELSQASSTPDNLTGLHSPFGTPSPFSFSQAPTATSSTPFTPPPISSTSIPSLLPPRFLLSSAQILLYDFHCCPEDLLSHGPGSSSGLPKTQASLTMQVRAVAGIRETSLRVRDAGLELLDYMVLPANLARVSPLVLDSLYAAMATLHWLWKEGGEEEIKTALEDVKLVLARLDMRWRLARDYLGMEKYHDVTAAMQLRNGG